MDSFSRSSSSIDGLYQGVAEVADDDDDETRRVIVPTDVGDDDGDEP